MPSLEVAIIAFIGSIWAVIFLCFVASCYQVCCPRQSNSHIRTIPRPPVTTTAQVFVIQLAHNGTNQDTPPSYEEAMQCLELPPYSAQDSCLLDDPIHQ